MIKADQVRRLCATRWLRGAAVSVAIAVVLTSLLAILGRTNSVPVTLQRALIHAAISCGLAGWTLPRVRHRLRSVSVAVGWSLMMPVLLSVSVTGTSLACGLITLLGLNSREPFLACFASDLPINALVVVTVGISMILYEAQRARLEAVTLELRTRELDYERARKMALEARLSSLESRLQPHFLFNTLNAISALIQDDPDRAERTVERLAALLRFSLDASERGLVPLAHELKIVADYLEIEKTRLGDRLSFVVNVHPDVSQCEIPPLAVQTLVENSVKHAIAPRPGGGRLRVEAAAVGHRVVLGVWDDGSGFTPAAMCPGHGLDNLQGRLAGRFGSAAALTVARRDGGTLVTVSLPRTRIDGR